MAESERLSLEDVVAIDVHAHVEMSQAGGDSLPDELRDAAVQHFRGESARPTAVELAQYYRERKMMAVVFTVDSESFTGQTRVPNEEIAAGGESECRRPDPVREHRPAQGEARRRRGPAPDRRARRARLQVPPERAGVLPERPAGLPAVRGDRGGRAARALPHRTVGRRLGPARWRRRPSQVLQPDARRRRRRRLPRAHDRARPPVVSLAGRGARCGGAQAAGVHRPLRAGRRSTSRRNSSSTRTRCSGSGCCSAATTRSSRPTAGWRTSRRWTSSPR